MAADPPPSAIRPAASALGRKPSMNLINALAISIGILAAVATWLCLGTPYGLAVWALFIGWGSFYHTGGGTAGFAKSAVNHAWGAAVAAIALFMVATVGGSVVVTSGIVGPTEIAPLS